jgi:hypothetical protein
MLGTRNALLPTLSGFVNASNVGQAGSITTTPQPIFNNQGQLLGYRQLGPGDVNSFLVGGYGTVLSQILSRNFPNYSAGISLSIPLRNRSAQADQVNAEISYRQQQISVKESLNNIKLQVINAWTAVRNARAAWETAVAARKLQDATLAGTRRKYELGTATILEVAIAQRDATTRQISEVDSLRQYQNAKTGLEQQLGRILDDYDVKLDEAKSGVVAREADPIPAVLQNTPAPVIRQR